MTQRIDMPGLVPDFYRAMKGLEQAVRGSGIDPALYELIKIRSSQINGCAFCLDMHNRDARKAGETQRRLDILSAWREAPSFFSRAERAALALTEATTLIADAGVPDQIWDEAVQALGDEGAAQALTAITVINTWNRLAIATRQSLPADG